MEKIVYYKIEEKIADSVRKILANVSDESMQQDYSLSEEEITDIQTFLDNVDVPDD
jgi:hypothetical protein